MNPREKLILAIIAIALVALASLTIIKIFPKEAVPVTYALSGYLSDENGVPVPGAFVSVDDLHTTTDENGYYKISGLAEKSYALIIETEKYGTYSVRVNVSKDTRHDVVIGVVEFKEFDEMHIYIDESGNANCQYVMQVPPSKLADFLKSLTPLVCTDVLEQICIEAVRKDLADFGLEVRNHYCEITGFGAEDNFKITLTWNTPSTARWKENRWTITYDWIDALATAKEAIAQEDDSWIKTRNIARMYGIQYPRYKISFRTLTILPESAENICCPFLGSSKVIDHGGGTYSRDSLYLENIDGRPTIINDVLTSIASENEITLTIEQLLENSLFYTIDYSGVFPENASFANSVEQVRLDLKYGRELEEQYSIYGEGSWYSLSPAQVLYHVADAIYNYNQGIQFSIQQPISVMTPDTENGDWGACWENLSKSEYISLAQTVRDHIKSTGNAPRSIQTSIGNIRFRDALYTFTRILSSYNESGELPNKITFAPVPTGELTLDNDKISANCAYFLLGDTFVITGTDRVNEVLGNVYRPTYNNREFALKLCEWANKNIAVAFSFRPPTSEEVLLNRLGRCRDYANVYLALTRTAEIPARRVGGWIVTEWIPPSGLWEVRIGMTPEGKPIGAHAWTQVFIDGRWVFVDPTWGRFENPTYAIYKQTEQSWRDALAGYETGYGLI